MRQRGDGMFADVLENEGDTWPPNPLNKSPKETNPLGDKLNDFTPSDKTMSLLSEGKELLSNIFGYEASTSVGYGLGATATVGPAKVEAELTLAEGELKTNSKNLVEGEVKGAGAKASVSLGEKKAEAKASTGTAKVEVDKKLNLKTSSDGARNQIMFNYVYNYTDHLGNIRMSYSLDKIDNVLKILEENHYYPFGLKHTNYNSDKKKYVELEIGDPEYDPGEFGKKIKPAPLTDAVLYKYKYNGKEYQDELGLNMYDYGMRNYDPAIGRFMKIDRFAEKYVDASPYHYSANSPVAFRDIAGDSIRTYFYDKHGKAMKSVPSAVQKMFNEEFGISVGYNSETNMLYYEGEVESDLSQSESATGGLVDALKDTNTGKNADKHGTLMFGYNLRGVKGGDVDGGQWDRTGGLYRRGVTQIDLADFDSQGLYYNMSYSSALNPRAFNMARIFEHEYLGGHQKLMIGGFGDGGEFTMGRVVKATNVFARERNLPERLNYGSGVIFFGNTLQYGNQGEQRKAVQSMVNGSTANDLFVKSKK